MRLLTGQSWLKSQDWLATNGKGERSPNSPDDKALDYHVWGVMLKYALRSRIAA